VVDRAETLGLSEPPGGVMGRESCVVGIFLSDQLGNFFVMDSGLAHVCLSLRLSLHTRVCARRVLIAPPPPLVPQRQHLIIAAE